ncbi:hypothetical protein [Undibacterium sp. Ren11W]|uniref:hypothetical protein n=1 Tax=Undibacterium sp. Ren11W TaxID=3413045 RepID=UPI003BF46270
MMKQVNRFILAVSNLLFSITLHAEVVVTEEWARATVPQQRATGAFFKYKPAIAGVF